jgi:hypothetical protein
MAAWSRCLNKLVNTFARAEVGEFDAFSRNEYIFWLDVSMENALAVDVLDRLEELVHVDLDLVLVKVLVAD